MGSEPNRRQFIVASSAAALAGCCGAPEFPKVPRQQRSQTPVVDIHCHIFNVRDLPIEGFAAQLLELPRFVQILLLRPLVNAYLATTRSDAADQEELRAAIDGDLPCFARIEKSTTEQQQRVLIEAVPDLAFDLQHPDGAEGGWSEHFPQLAARTLALHRAESTRPYGPAAPPTPSAPDAAYDPFAPVDAPTRVPDEDPSTDQSPPDDQAALVAFDALARAARERDAELHGFLGAPRESGLIGVQDFPVVGRVLDTLALFRGSRAQLAYWLVHTYPTVDLFTPLLIDFEGWVQDRPRTDLKQQYALMSLVTEWSMRTNLRTGEQGVNGPKIHPFAPFDPRRANGLDDLKRAIETHAFVGVKVYPPCGFRPSGDEDAEVQKNLEGLYAHCNDHDLPLMAHCSPSNALSPGAELKAHPRGWRGVLESHPRLRVCLGHAGHLARDDDPDAPLWLDDIADLMIEFPGRVFADISNSEAVESAAYRRRFTDTLAQRRPERRRAFLNGLLFGTDWFMNRIVKSRAAYFPLAWRELFGQWGVPDAEAMGRRALVFLGLREEDGRASTGSNRARLCALYDRHRVSYPRWLA